MYRTQPFRSLICVVWLAFAGVAFAADVPTAVSPEPFFRHADYGSMQISPSGKFVAVLAPLRGRLGLAVFDVLSRTATPAASVNGYDITTFRWVNDQRLVFSVSDLQSGLGEQRGGGLFAINRDGGEFRELAPTIQQTMSRLHFVWRHTEVLQTLDDGSDDLLVVANDKNELYPDVYRMDTKSGRKTLLSWDKPGNVIHWVADRDGAVRAAVAIENGTIERFYWRPGGVAKWILQSEHGLHDSEIRPVLFDGDGSLIVASNKGRDTLALYRYDPAKKALGELLAAHPHVDLLGGLIYDRTKKRIVGLRYDAERPGAAWFDEDWARIQKSVDAALPDRMNALARGDAPWMLVYSYSDIDPGSYYLLDLDKHKLEFFAATRKQIKPETMPKREPVRYSARDGLEIPAYLTLPNVPVAKHLPLVVYVHGGPWVRGSSWAWHAEPAFLATLGYAVLEPEFRGSTGWGNKLYLAGFKQWGKAMQDDLNDGVDWLAKQGTIDTRRVCIMGASYGGYAVMMGLARDPDRWRCGINYVGVTDINFMFDVTWSDFSNSDFIRYTAKEMIGDPDKDAVQLKATSPLENAARIKAPVLLAYGGGDRRVPVVHGEKMRDALLKQGTPVEWVLYNDEGHGFWLEANRFDFYGRVARFLDANIGAKAPKRSAAATAAQ